MNMIIKLWMFLLIVFLLNCETETAKNKEVDPPKLIVLPGIGFDALTSLNAQPISEINYKYRHKTPDERFLAPSGYIVSLKQDFEIRVDVFSHYSDFFAVTAPTLNSIKWQRLLSNEETACQIDGSFSKRYKRAKRLYLNDQLSTIRTAVRFTLYKIYMYKDHKLHPALIEKVQKVIIDVLNDNLVGAIKNAEKIISEFGTRHISSIDVGGLFVREEFLNKSFVVSNRDEIASNAIRSFLEFVSSDWPSELQKYFQLFRFNDSSMQRYSTHRESTDTYVIGGNNDLNLKRWMTTVRDNLAIIDRDGEEIHKTILSASSFRDYSSDILNTTSKIIKFALERYYRLNTHKGCMRIHDNLFDSSVNFPERKSCDKHYKALTLGGFYQTCYAIDKLTKDFCGDFRFINILTGFLNCPAGYDDSLIFKKTINYTCPSTFRTSLPCAAIVETHWCSANDFKINVTYRFGGIFSSFVTNLLTGNRSCPVFFHSISLLSMKVCMSYDFLEKKTERYQMSHFGGIIVLCTNDNANQLSSCPIGYTRHFATFYESCELYYCAQFGLSAMHLEMQLLRPPTYVESDKPSAFNKPKPRPKFKPKPKFKPRKQFESSSE